MGISNYVLEKEVIDNRVEYLERHIERLIKLMAPDGIKGINYTDEGHGGIGTRETLNVLTEILETKDEIARLKIESAELRLRIETVKKSIEQINDAPTKVRLLKSICGLSLPEIARETGYSYDYIKHLSSNVKK